MDQTQRYRRAVDELTARIFEDRTIVAAILGGSAAWDVVWEKSDIDLFLVGEESVRSANFTLLADDIVVHAYLMPRSNFRQMMQKLLGGDFMNSMLSKSRLLFSRDDALLELWENASATIGARDRRSQLLRIATDALPMRDKAQKWHAVKRDFHYASLYILYIAQTLARLEVVFASQNPGREALAEAMTLNPDFFTKIYTGRFDAPPTDESVGDALAAIDDYLLARADECFGPLLDFLDDAGAARSTREIDAYMEKHWHMESTTIALDYLTEIGKLIRVPIPMRLSKDSRVTLDEAGYASMG